MKFIFIAVLCSICLCCTTEKKKESPKVDAKKGYKDLILDAPYDSLKSKNGFVQSTTKCEGIKQYEATTGSYTQIGGILFDKVILKYAQDSLSNTLLYKQYASSDFTTLSQLYKSEFGEPSETESKKLGDSDLTTYTWSGKNIRIHLEGSPIVGILISYSSSRGTDRVFKEEQKCNQRQLEKAKTEL